MTELKPHQTVIKAPSVEAAKTWIEANDPAYFERYYGHCYLICDQPVLWEERVQTPKPVHSQLVDESTLGFHLLAEVDAGEITTRDDVMTWFKRSLAAIQGLIKEAVVERVLGDLLKTQMLYETAGRLMITDIGRISAVWYYRPEDIFSWWKSFEWIADRNLWDSDAALAWAVGSAPNYNLDYIPKNQTEQVENYMAELNKVVPHAVPSPLPADLHDQLAGRQVPYARLAAFRHDSSRIFQALRQIAKACGWERPEGYWHLLETRMRHGATQETAELTELAGLGVMLVRKLSRFGIRNVEQLLDKANRHKVERILGRKTNTVLASARQHLRTRYQV